jgi:hydrogenase maturation factor
MKFPLGKVPVEVLQKIVFKNLGVKRNDIILGPAIGVDVGIVKAGETTLAVSTDPITGAEEWIGWLAVNVSANDVATCGAKPLWFTSCMLLPEDSNEDLIKKICEQIDRAARQLGIAVIAGHCEITPGINHPIVVGCSMGVIEGGKYVVSSGAKPGNRLILTKGMGIEGTAILASDRRSELLKAFDETFLNRAEKFFEKISVVKEALIAFETGGVTAMHDPTEGGVAGGIHELADASKVGFQVYEERILIPEETKKICAYFDVDPLQLIGSGSLLIVAEKEKSEEIVSDLSHNGVYASIIGETTKSAYVRKMVTRNGEKIDLVRPVSDHLWVALAKQL